MSAARLEHANITVSDPDRSAALFERLCGWHERWRGPSQLGGWTIHIGTPEAYLALYTNEGRGGPFAKGAPLNHIGIEVDDLDAAEAVVAAHLAWQVTALRPDDGADALAKFRSNRFAGLLLAAACYVVGNTGG